MGGEQGPPVPLPANGLLHVLRFSTISSRLPPPREEPGPCPGSLRFHAALSRSQKNGGPATSRSGSLPSRRKRKYGKRPCIRGTLPTAPASPLRHHIADFGETAYHSPKNTTDAGPGPERIPRARFPIRRIMAQKGAQKRPEAASVRSLPKIAGRSVTGGVLSFHAQRRRGRMAELRLLPRHRPRLQRHRTDAGRGRVLRAPNH